MKVDLEEHEWSQVITAIASAHPLIAKISTQLVAQKKANGDAAGQVEREREHPPATPRGIPAPASDSNLTKRSEKSS